MPSTKTRRITKTEAKREAVDRLLKRLYKNAVTLNDKDYAQLVRLDETILPMDDLSDIVDIKDLDDHDFTLAEHGISSLAARKETATELDTSGPGTKQVCIRIPNHLIAAYKRQAASCGSKYQTLMVRALLETSDGWKK